MKIKIIFETEWTDDAPETVVTDKNVSIMQSDVYDNYDIWWWVEGCLMIVGELSFSWKMLPKYWLRGRVVFMYFSRPLSSHLLWQLPHTP